MKIFFKPSLACKTVFSTHTFHSVIAIMKLKNVKQVRQINFPQKESSQKSKWATRQSCETKRIYLANKSLIAAERNIVQVHRFASVNGESEKKAEEFGFAERLTTIELHAGPITSVAFSDDPEYICSCSENSVVLSKWDDLLKRWDSYRIGEELGKIIRCCICHQYDTTYCCLCKANEIHVISVTEIHPCTERGPMILQSMDTICNVEKVREYISWCRAFFLDSQFYVLTVSAGNNVSLKVWVIDIKLHSAKLLDHRLTGLRSLADADMALQNSELFLLIGSADGSVEAYSFSKVKGISIVTRIKLNDKLKYSDESLATPRIAKGSLENLDANANSQVQIEFNLLSLRLVPESIRDLETVELSSTRVGDGDSANKISLGGNNVMKLCPDPVFIASTSEKLYCVNWKSGAPDFVISYIALGIEEFCSIDACRMSYVKSKQDFLLAAQPLFSNAIYIAELSLESTSSTLDDESTNQINCSLTFTGGSTNPKSILRKKVKSPPQRPTNPYLPRTNLKRRDSYLWRPNRSQSSPNMTTSKFGTTSRRQSMSKPPTLLNAPKSARGRSEATGLQSARGTSIQSDAKYSNANLTFDENRSHCFHPTLSQGMSSIRMSMTRDGKYLAVGGNLNPLSLVKIYPRFENVKTFKDGGKITTLDFSFCTNYLLIGSSECETKLLNWQTGKEHFNFRFSSKFNEHVHSQFYYMDQFILQPEENKLSLYSCKLNESRGCVKLKAGSFAMSGQWITAVAAANQLYSNVILSALSNKSIHAFDANVERTVLTIPNAHSKPISCIRINEAPQGSNATDLCNFFLTFCPYMGDPLKLWDLRAAKNILKISDISEGIFASTSRPALSPCGRYVACGAEDGATVIYDVRKINSRVATLKGTKYTTLDSCFHPTLPMLWCACRDGTLWSYYSS